MNKRRIGRIVVWWIPVLMVLWGSYQLIDLFSSRAAHQDAARMLFEASHFQIELMSRFMSEANRAKTSSELSELKNAVYAASFVHERLVNAFPQGQIDRLESLSTILQYILHMQIGGDRPLKEEERSMLQTLEPLFAELSAAYANLITADGKPNRYERGLLRQVDDDLIEAMRGQN